MIRSSVSRGLLRSSFFAGIRRSQANANHPTTSFSTRAIFVDRSSPHAVSSIVFGSVNRNLLRRLSTRRNVLPIHNQHSFVALRSFSSSKESSTGKGNKDGAEGGSEDDDMSKELVLTPGEKVVAATRLTMWAGIAVFASVCAYYIAKELIPTYVVPFFQRNLLWRCPHLLTGSTHLSTNSFPSSLTGK